MPLPWFKRGIFQHFVFDEATQKNLECLPNMVGQCSLCITRKSVGGVYQCTTNYVRHVKVSSYSHFALIMI